MRDLRNVLVTMLCFTMISATSLFSQEWSAKQKEVWKNVETYWDLDAKRDLDGFMGYFHADYSGWFNRSALPSGKNSVKKWVGYSFKTTEILVQEIKPVAIKVHGNMAIVHYTYARLVKDVEGKQKNRSGRWTDILMKQGDKWVLIGDHGGPSSN